jgi:hypothetical protein
LNLVDHRVAEPAHAKFFAIDIRQRTKRDWFVGINSIPCESISGSFRARLFEIIRREYRSCLVFECRRFGNEAEHSHRLLGQFVRISLCRGWFQQPVVA